MPVERSFRVQTNPNQLRSDRSMCIKLFDVTNFLYYLIPLKMGKMALYLGQKTQARTIYRVLGQQWQQTQAASVE